MESGFLSLVVSLDKGGGKKFQGVGRDEISIPLDSVLVYKFKNLNRTTIW